MFKNLLSLYSIKYPKALVSLMHKSKYNSHSYLKVLHKTKNFSVALKDPAPKTTKTMLAIRLLGLGMLIQIAVGIIVIILGADHHISGGIFFGVAIILIYPLTWAYLSCLSIVFREWATYGSGAGK
jgi:hypothetical protein